MLFGIDTEAMGAAGGVGGVGAAILTGIKMLLDRQDRAAIYKRLDEQDDEISAHAVLVARDYVLKEELNGLRDHIDLQFSELRTQIFAALSGKNQNSP